MTAMTRARRRESGPSAARRGALVLAAAAVVAAAVWLWSGPRERVDVPGPEGSAEEVVLAYAAALNARDFETVDLIDARIDQAPGRFSRTTRIDDVEITSVTGGDQRARVVFSGWDASMDDGVSSWGYYLRRDHDGRWCIVDAGVA